ncbi:MAG: hypothetical protein Kow0088_22120 [Anaerolineales bacterium]
MLKTLNWIGLVIILLGLVIAGIDFPKHWPQGLFVTGIGIAISAMESLITGIEISTSSRRYEQEFFWPPSSATFLGGTARLWAATKILFGGIVACISLREWFSPGWATEWIKSPPGQAQLLLGGGLVVTMTGIVGVLGPVESRKSMAAILLSPSRWLGMVLLFVGLALLWLGVLHWVAPGTIGNWIRDFLLSIGYY